MDALIGIIGIIIIIIAGLLCMAYQIHNVGRIKAVGVKFYWDKECTNQCTEINWGTINIGSEKSVVLYAKNIKTVDITLNITTQNWKPEGVTDYITTRWNYTGEVIVIDRIIPIIFTLNISPDITEITDFSFDYLIWAVENPYL